MAGEQAVATIKGWIGAVTDVALSLIALAVVLQVLFGDHAVFLPGDVIMVNDPFMGGTHLPDITLITPIFHAGKLFALAANRAHHSDIGGMSPGSMPVSTEINDLFFQLEEAQTGAELLEIIEAYVDGNAGN